MQNIRKNISLLQVNACNKIDAHVTADELV